MMGKTHLTIGMASSLTVSFLAVKPNNISDFLVVLAGGAIGGVLADVDILDDDYEHDALIGQVLGFLILASVIVIDYLCKLGVCDFVITSNKILSIIAGVVFLALYIIGFISDHRTFTHSLLAMVLFSGCFAVIYPRLGFSVLIGYASHLLLDLLNKKEVPLLYPLKKGICFRLCYADKTANTVFMYVGLAATVILSGYRLFTYFFN